MKLSEFCLWAFKLELEMARKFTLFNRCVCAHFERHFVSIDTEDVYRVVVKLCEQDERIGTTEIGSSVIQYYKEFDFEHYGSLALNTKKRFLLDTLYDSLLSLCDVYGWPKIEFSRAYEKVILEDFINVYTIKKKFSRNKGLCAELIADHNERSFDCYLVVKNSNDKVILNEILFSEQPDEFLFNGRIGDIRWIDKNTITHVSRDKRELARFEIKDAIAN